MYQSFGNALIKKIATREGRGESEVRQEMEEAIRLAYANPKSNKLWSKLFGEGHMPSVGEFVIVMANCKLSAY